jgi:AhpC/TSA family
MPRLARPTGTAFLSGVSEGYYARRNHSARICTAAERAGVILRRAGLEPDLLSLYQSELAEFEQRGAQVLAISVDSLYSHGAWAAVRGLSFPLLADFQPKGAVAEQYQVYREQDGFSERARYVIDGDGIIRYAHVSPQFKMLIQHQHLAYIPLTLAFYEWK